MNDTPGWASPGSAPSDGQAPDASRPTDAAAGQHGPAGPADDKRPSSKWSKEQPPPGQWSAPGPGDPGPTPPRARSGWGGQPPRGPGGYRGDAGNGWGGPPPADKPGVIPLRPLGVGEILDGAVSTMRAYWRTVLGISLAVAAVTEIGALLLQGFVLDDSSVAALEDPNATLDEVARAMGDVLLGSGVVVLISVLGTIVATALLTTVTSRAVLGKQVTIRQAWADARPRLLRLFGLTFLLPLIAFAIVGVGILPGLLIALAGAAEAGAALAALGALGAASVALWLMIRFSLASPALMLEKQGILKSMSRSAKLVRGSWWRVFGIGLLAAIIATIVAWVIMTPFALLAGALSGAGFRGFIDGGAGNFDWTFLIVSGIGSVLGSTLTFPITAGVTVLLYIDQRIRREALDLELARAAGAQGYAPGAPGTPGS